MLLPAHDRPSSASLEWSCAVNSVVPGTDCWEDLKRCIFLHYGLIYWSGGRCCGNEERGRQMHSCLQRSHVARRTGSPLHSGSPWPRISTETAVASGGPRVLGAGTVLLESPPRLCSWHCDAQFLLTLPHSAPVMVTTLECVGSCNKRTHQNAGVRTLDFRRPAVPETRWPWALLRPDLPTRAPAH